MDIYVDDLRVFRSLAYGAHTKYFLLDASKEFNVTLKMAEGNEIWRRWTVVPEQLMDGCPQTFVFWGPCDNLVYKIVDEICSPSGKGSHLNFLHLYVGMGPLDVSIDDKAICVTDRSGEVNLWTNVPYTETTDMKLIANPSMGPFQVTISRTLDPHPIEAYLYIPMEDGYSNTIYALGELYSDIYTRCNTGGTHQYSNCSSCSDNGSMFIYLPTEFVSSC